MALMCLLLGLSEAQGAKIRLVVQNCQIRFSSRAVHCDISRYIKRDRSDNSDRDIDNFDRLYNNLNLQGEETMKVIFHCHTFNRQQGNQTCELNYGTFVQLYDPNLSCSIDVGEFKSEDLYNFPPTCNIVRLVPGKAVYTLNIQWQIPQEERDHSSKYFDVIVAMATITSLVVPRTKINNRQIITFLGLLLTYWSVISLQELEISLWTSAEQLTRYGRHAAFAMLILVTWIVWNVVIAPGCYIARRLVFVPMANGSNPIINGLIYRNYAIANFVVPSLSDAGKSESSIVRPEIIIDVIDLTVQVVLITLTVISHCL